MKKTLLFSLLLYVCVTTITSGQQKLDKFESQIIEFEQEDHNEGYKQESILFTGSSSIRMWKSLENDISPIPVLNRGFGGSTIPEVTYFADRIILPHQPKILVFYCGENDIANDDAKSKLALKSFKKFYTYMKKNLPETEVFFIAIKPSVKRWNYWNKMNEANSKIKKFIDRKDNYYFVDTASKMLDENGIVLQDIFIKDNLHMNAKGYEIWTNTLKPILEQYYAN